MKFSESCDRLDGHIAALIGSVLELDADETYKVISAKNSIPQEIQVERAFNTTGTVAGSEGRSNHPAKKIQDLTPVT